MVNNLGPLWCSVRVVDDMPRAGSHYNLGTSRGPDKIGSPAGPGPRAASCTWLIYTTKIDGVVCPPNISETVAGRLMKLGHRQRIASTAIKLI